jgi:hypothetical protein
MSVMPPTMEVRSANPDPVALSEDSADPPSGPFGVLFSVLMAAVSLAQKSHEISHLARG